MTDHPDPAAPASGKHIVGLLLAAGRSRRFGSPKLLAQLPDGSPMGVVSARALRSAVSHLVVVLAEGDDALRDSFIAAGFTDFAYAPAEGGLGISLACGVRATTAADGWLVALGDMPFVRADTVRSVVEAIRQGAWIAAPFFDGRRGHPVGFCSGLRHELLALQGDTGARSVLERHVGRLQRVDCVDAGVELDVDRPEEMFRRP